MDIGGTLTGFALLAEPSGDLLTLKVPSDPARPAAPLAAGLRRLRDAHGVDAAQVVFFTHGTTIAVSTLIERAGARLALLVTEGFRGLLEIQRLRLPRTQDFTAERPRPLVPRERVFEVRERLRADGRVHTPLARWDAADLAAEFARLTERARADLAVHFAEARAATFRPAMDLRYLGQSFELTVPLEEAWIRRGDLGAIAAAFHRAHERAYAHADPAAPVEVVTLRLTAEARLGTVRLPESKTGTGRPTPSGAREIRADGQRLTAAVYPRDRLAAGQRFRGPAIVEQDDATTLILPAFAATVDPWGNLLLVREG